MKFVIEVHDSIGEELVDAFAVQYGYLEKVPTTLTKVDGIGRGMVVNPMSKEEFMMQAIRRNLRDIVMNTRAQAAAKELVEKLNVEFGVESAKEERPN